MPSDLQKARGLFLHAVGKLRPEEWDHYVAGASEDDLELKQEVMRLLRLHREAGSFLEHPAAALGIDDDFKPTIDIETVSNLIQDASGSQIGPYKLLQVIGEGGMGTVYLAEQTQPVRRQVALKVIKPGMDSRQVVARFEAERQALALMDHVNIARVFDGGTTDSGRPYFVMELVRGVPITKYCDDHHLTPRQRLELFVQVCQAIQHAHQKGIIHRDIKPTNVMVTLSDEGAVPKVIDFGVAKATEQKLTEQSLFTQFGSVIGTFEYMSPEQAEMNAMGVDTRSDIYSLGVLLYELLTGSTPLGAHRMKEATFAEILRMIKEEEPPKPSTRLSDSGEAIVSISANRHMDPTRLTRMIRGELDWIVMKALEKDRTRRYETASALATDVQRYLADEPVMACPPSEWYRFRKFAHRNRRAVATGSAIGLAVLVAVGVLAVSTVLITRAWRSETDALVREQHDAYLHRIALAHRELTSSNLRRGRELLDECPEQLRDWEWHYLARLSKAGDPPFIRNNSEINSIAFGRGGKWIAAACGDGSVKIWDSRSLESVLSIPNAHNGFASSVVFHPDGNHLASVGVDGWVRVWDLRFDPPKKVFDRPCDAFRPMGTAYAVAFHPSDSRYLVAGSGGAVNLWDWEHDRLEHQFVGHQSIPISVTFSHDGKWLASGDWRGRINLWNVDNRGEPVFTQTISNSPISALAFRAGTSELATASYDRRVDLWSANTGEHIRSISFAWRRAITCLAFGGPNNRLLATSGEDKTVHIREAATGREFLGLRGHTETVTCLAFSPDSQRLISAGKDRTIRIWDGTPLQGDETQEEAQTFSHHKNEVWSLAVRPTDGRLVVSGGFKTPAIIWDAQSGNEITRIPGQAAVVFCVAWSTDGQLVVSAGVSDDAKFNVKVITPHDRTIVFEQTAPSEFMAVAFHPDGKHLITGQQDRTIQMWNLQTKKLVGTVGIHEKAVRGLMFSRDGKYLASMGLDGEIKLWDAKNLDEQHMDGKAELRVARMKARSPGMCVNLAFSPDSRFLTSGGEEYTVKIFDVTTGLEARTPLRGHTEDIYAVAFSPDGRWLASAGEDSTVRLWDCRAGYALTHTLRGHTGLVNSLAFSPDSKKLFTGSNDFTVNAWDMTQLKDRPAR